MNFRARIFIALQTVLLCLLHVASGQTQTSASTLAQKAASMTPGQWVLLNQDGDASGYGLDFTSSGQGTIYGYASKAAFDPVRKRVFYLASGHNRSPDTLGFVDAGMKYVVYELDKDKWTRLSTPEFITDLGTAIGNSHGYQLQTIAPGQFFRGWANTNHIYVCDINKDNLADIGGTNCPGDYPNPATTPTAGIVARGNLEYFPDRNSLVFNSGGEIYEKNLSGADWRTVAYIPELGGDGVAAAYNPVEKVIVIGGGTWSGLENHKWWKYDVNGNLSRIDDAPVGSYAASLTLFSVDPISGSFILIRPNDLYTTPTAYEFYELDLTRAPGTQWVRRTELESAIPQFYAEPNSVFATVVVPIPEYGVSMFLGYKNVWLYKHSAGSGSPAPVDTTAPAISSIAATSITTSQATINWTTDEVADGQVEYGLTTDYDRATIQNTFLSASHSFGLTGLSAGTVYHYRVNSKDASGNPTSATDHTFMTLAVAPSNSTTASTFTDKCAQPGVLGCWGFDDPSELKYSWDTSNAALNSALVGKSHYTISERRLAGEGNTFANQQISGELTIPVIDNTTYDSGGGSLKFTIPSQSGQQSGYFIDSFNKILGSPSYYIDPASPNGNVFYMQFKLRVNDVMLDQKFQEFAALVYNLTTPAAGSTTLNSPDAVFTTDMVGRKLALTGTNFVWGIYTITGFISPNSVTLDRSPTPNAAGTGGGAEISSTHQAGGWKVVILYGNAPDGSSSSGTEITMNDGNQLSAPQMYGQQGTDAPAGMQTTVPFLRNIFQEITIRVEMLGGSNQPTNHVTWWRNGVMAGDWTTAKAMWGNASDGNGYGFGQFQLTPFHTRKDPTQVHDTGYMWFDDVIVSTQPIPMVAGVPESPLVGQWKFDETSGTTAADSSGRNNNGALVNGPAWSAGKNGNALSFNGTDNYVDLGANVARLTKNFTVAGWLKRSTDMPPGGFGVWVSEGVDGSGGWAAYIQNNGSTHEHRFLKSGVSITSTDIPNSKDAWEYVVWTVDSNSRPALYLNGSLVFTSSDALPIGSPGTAHLYMGADQGPAGTATSFFGGLLDDVRLYNRALSASEIAATFGGSDTSGAIDTVPPTVSLITPTSTTVTTGTSVTITASASDNVNVAAVQFKVDGANLGAEQTTTPCSIGWDTTNISIGPHLLTAVARDVSGNQTTSAPVVVTVSENNVPKPTSLAGYWKLDEDIGVVTVDSAGQNNPGALVNGVGWSLGMSGSAVMLTGGQDHVDLGANVPRLTKDFTIVGWIKRTGSTAPGTFRMWFSQGVDGSNGWAAYVHNTGAGYEHRFLKGGLVAVSSGVSNRQEWEHVAWVIDSNSKPSLYLNGSLVYSGTDTALIASLPEGLDTYIGADAGPAGTMESFPGLIDDVQLYTRALSASEIAVIYSGSSSDSATSPSTGSIAAPDSDATVRQ